MIKALILIIVLSYLLSMYGFAIQKGAGEENFSRNVIFLEAGGNGVGFSVNQEGFFTKKVGLRLGLGSLAVYGLSIPIMLNYYLGEDNNKLELGAGITHFSKGTDDGVFGDRSTVLIGVTMGLRHQNKYHGVVIRVSFTPLFNLSTNRFIPFGGLSLGFSF